MATEDPEPADPTTPAAAMPGGYLQCDADCPPPARAGGMIWCRSSTACAAPCQCRLFAFDPAKPDAGWDMVAGPNQKVTENTALSYRCWCVRPAPGGGGGGGSAAREITVRLADIVDADHAEFSPAALAEAPVTALSGLSAGDAAALDQAFGVSTIRDLAQLKYVRWATSIVALADAAAPAGPSCDSIPDLALDLDHIRLEKPVPGEDWMLTVARFMDGVRSRHCDSGGCGTGRCTGRERSGNVRLHLDAADHIIVTITAQIHCVCA